VAGASPAVAWSYELAYFPRRRQAESPELRAAMNRSRLWQQAKGHEARELLVPIYGWFTQGFGTTDLQEAQGLLEQLPWRCNTATDCYQRTYTARTISITVTTAHRTSVLQRPSYLTRIQDRDAKPNVMQAFRPERPPH
jgi:hypothetical protein